MHFKIGLFSALILFSSVLKGQNYTHNIILYPVIEGVSLGYEFSPEWSLKKRMGFRATYLNRQKGDGSILFSLNNYMEHKIQLQTKVYMSKSKRMEGFFHGIDLRAKKLEGERNDFFFSREFVVDQDPINVKINTAAFSAGYMLGYQKVLASGFNWQASISSTYQWSRGHNDLNSYWLDIVTYQPYIYGLSLSAQMGVGLAF